MGKKYDMLTGIASVTDKKMLQNRIQKVTRYMQSEDIDMLLVCDIQKEGYYRWFSGERCFGNPDQEMIMVSRDGKVYMGMEDAAELYHNNPWKTFGVVHMDKLRQEVYEYWNHIDKEFRWKDCTEEIRKIAVKKTSEEIEIMRHVQEMQYNVYHKVKEYIKPGLYEKDIVSYARFTADKMGGGGIDKRLTAQIFMECLTDHAKNLSWPGRKIEENDIYTLQLRLVGDDGYYGESAGCIFVGGEDREIRNWYDILKNIQKEITALLEKGITLYDVEKLIEKKGLYHQVEVEIRGIGYAHLEGPSTMYGYETLKIAEGMTLVILIKKKLDYIGELKISDVYHVNKEEIKRLIGNS